jgi:hypothetical protein
LAKTKKRGGAGPQPRPPKSKPLISPIQIGLVVVAALLIVGGLIVLGNQARGVSGQVDLDRFPTLGAADAPVTFVEYSDYG